MTTDISLNPAPAAGTSTENASPNVETTAPASTINQFSGKEINTPAPAVDKTTESQPAVTPVVTPDGKVAYVPNYKYKAALQEKELDPFFHSLIKDQDSEKKVKDLFTKVDAFDFIKGKKEQIEGQFTSLMGDYDSISGQVTKFNESVKNNDLSSAFRLSGINKDQVFKWAQQQLALMEMPPEQRQQYEQFEQTKLQKSELEERVTSLQSQYETQATQARVMQLDFALSRPEVAQFAQAWDTNGEAGSFKTFVIDEAKKIFYETQQDLSPEQVISHVMKRFGRFFNTGETVSQSPQVINQANGQQPKPVIPNIMGKAASPIKKAPRSLDDLKKMARALPD